MVRYSPPMAGNLDTVRAAYEASNKGDAEPIIALFEPEAVWRGVERGVLWWKTAPS